MAPGLQGFCAYRVDAPVVYFMQETPAHGDIGEGSQIWCVNVATGSTLFQLATQFEVISLVYHYKTDSLIYLEKQSQGDNSNIIILNSKTAQVKQRFPVGVNKNLLKGIRLLPQLDCLLAECIWLEGDTLIRHLAWSTLTWEAMATPSEEALRQSASDSPLLSLTSGDDDKVVWINEHSVKIHKNETGTVSTFSVDGQLLHSTEVRERSPLALSPDGHIVSFEKSGVDETELEHRFMLRSLDTWDAVSELKLAPADTELKQQIRPDNRSSLVVYSAKFLETKVGFVVLGVILVDDDSVCDEDSVLQVLDVSSGELVQEKSGFGLSCALLEIGDLGVLVAVSGAKMVAWDMTTWTCLCDDLEIGVYPDDVIRLLWIPDRRLVVVLSDYSIGVVSAGSWEEVHCVDKVYWEWLGKREPEGYHFIDFAWTGSMQSLVTCDWDNNKLVVWKEWSLVDANVEETCNQQLDLVGVLESLRMAGDEGLCKALRWIEELGVLVSCHWAGAVVVWNIKNGEALLVTQTKGEALGMLWVPHAEVLVAEGKGGQALRIQLGDLVRHGVRVVADQDGLSLTQLRRGAWMFYALDLASISVSMMQLVSFAAMTPMPPGPAKGIAHKLHPLQDFGINFENLWWLPSPFAMLFSGAVAVSILFSFAIVFNEPVELIAFAFPGSWSAKLFAAMKFFTKFTVQTGLIFLLKTLMRAATCHDGAMLEEPLIACLSPVHFLVMGLAVTCMVVVLFFAKRLIDVDCRLDALEVDWRRPLDTSNDTPLSADRIIQTPVTFKTISYDKVLITIKTFMTIIPRILGGNIFCQVLVNFAAGCSIVVTGFSLDRYHPGQRAKGRGLEPNSLATSLDCGIFWTFSLCLVAYWVPPEAPPLRIASLLTPAIMIFGYFLRNGSLGCRGGAAENQVGDEIRYQGLREEEAAKGALTQGDPADESCEAPKSLLNAYLMFVRATRPTMTFSLGEIAKLLSSLWSSMDPCEKASYEQAAKELKLSYDEDLAKYKNSKHYKQKLADLRQRGVRC